MELNLSELTFISFNSVNLTEFTAVNNLIAIVTMEKPQLSKAHLTTLNLNNFKTIESMRLKNYCIEVNFNDSTSVPNLMKIYQAVQKLLVGGGGHTDRLTDTDW
jgi:hypothetical protein